MDLEFIYLITWVVSVICVLFYHPITYHVQIKKHKPQKIDQEDNTTEQAAKSKTKVANIGLYVIKFAIFTLLMIQPVTTINEAFSFSLTGIYSLMAIASIMLFFVDKSKHYIKLASVALTVELVFLFLQTAFFETSELIPFYTFILLVLVLIAEKIVHKCKGTTFLMNVACFSWLLSALSIEEITSRYNDVSDTACVGLFILFALIIFGKHKLRNNKHPLDLSKPMSKKETIKHDFRKLFLYIFIYLLHRTINQFLINGNDTSVLLFFFYLTFTIKIIYNQALKIKQAKGNKQNYIFEILYALTHVFLFSISIIKLCVDHDIIQMVKNMI